MTLSFYSVGPRNGAWIIILSYRYLYLMSHLVPYTTTSSFFLPLFHSLIYLFCYRQFKIQGTGEITQNLRALWCSRGGYKFGSQNIYQAHICLLLLQSFWLQGKQGLCDSPTRTYITIKKINLSLKSI